MSALHHRFIGKQHQPARNDGCLGRRLVAFCLFVTTFAYGVWRTQVTQPISLVSLLNYPGWLDGDNNLSNDGSIVEGPSNHLNHLRQDFEKLCNHNDTVFMDPTSLRQLLQERLSTFFKPPPKSEKRNIDDPVKPCRYTFLDLGANVGDSLGKFIDAGLPCNCHSLMQMKSRPHYNIDKGTVVLGSQAKNDLTAYARRITTQLSRRPEEYCYVGVEGNPLFTARLQELEARVMGSTPRPIRSAHFYTETVAAGLDAPTVLYLDTVNPQHNFWGSSILATHNAAKKSAIQNNNVAMQAPVTGLTLSTLLKHAVRQEPGAHVLIKLDIEGGEYPVMNEAIDTLCNYTRAGVRVDMILETHGLNVVGEETPDMTLFLSKTQHRLKVCNIYQGALSAREGQ